MAFLFVLPTWPKEIWAAAMAKAAPDADIRIWPDHMGNVAEIDYVAAWLPPPNVIKDLPNLKVIFSLGAGVDAILRDETLPKHVPIVRINDDDLTNRMSEYIVWQVLAHHRQTKRLADNQRAKIWDSFATHRASAMTVGIMGLGVMGQDSAKKLRMMGFNVVGWSRTKKTLDGVTCYAGPQGFDAFLTETDILVSLLPATKETDSIVNAQTISKLSRRGPFGAPIFINAGRGRQQVASDVLAALKSGALYAATLDVFATEPLPADDPLWSHPNLTLTPHCAADSDPLVICQYIAAQIKKHQAGNVLQNLVDHARGY